MFTQTLEPDGCADRVLRSPLVDLLTGPHGVDRYTELVDPDLDAGRSPRQGGRRCARDTPRSVTLTLEPNRAVHAGFRAGQHINLTVEIDGRRHTRCYSPASAEGAPLHRADRRPPRRRPGVDLPVRARAARHGASVSTRVGGDFLLPAARPRRILFVSGGSGITPVMSMLRTLRAEGFDGEIAFIHYARTRRGGLLPRRARRHARRAGAARLHPRRTRAT